MRGGSPRPAGSDKYYNGNIPFIKVADITRNNGMYLNTHSHTIKEAGLFKTRQIEKDTLLLTNSGATLGVPKIITFDATINDGIAAFLFLPDGLKLYLYWFLMTITMQMRDINQGAAQPNLNTDIIKEIEMPLPPLAEQHCIVAAIESAFAVIDEIERNKTDLQSAVVAAKSKILSLAIRGKLVPQDPNDEPASALLERIRTEREALFKQGKTKRGKSETTAARSCDNSYYENVPFDVPESWEWYRLSDVWGLLSGRDLTPSEYSDSEVGIPYITGASNFIDGGLIINRWTACPKVIAQDGDLLITCKGTVGAMLINTQGEVHIARQIMAILNLAGMNVDFLRYAMTSFIAHITSAAKGIIPGISRDDLLEMLIPCPPLREQQRIVNAIESANMYLDEIAENQR